MPCLFHVPGQVTCKKLLADVSSEEIQQVSKLACVHTPTMASGLDIHMYKLTIYMLSFKTTTSHKKPPQNCFQINCLHVAAATHPQAVGANVLGSLLGSRAAVRLMRAQTRQPQPCYHIFNLGFSSWGAAFSK